MPYDPLGRKSMTGFFRHKNRSIHFSKSHKSSHSVTSYRYHSPTQDRVTSPGTLYAYNPPMSVHFILLPNEITIPFIHKKKKNRESISGFFGHENRSIHFRVKPF